MLHKIFIARFANAYLVQLSEIRKVVGDDVDRLGRDEIWPVWSAEKSTRIRGLLDRVHCFLRWI